MIFSDSSSVDAKLVRKRSRGLHLSEDEESDGCELFATVSPTKRSGCLETAVEHQVYLFGGRKF